MARDNWGLSGVLDSLTPRGHLPYPHSLREGRNHSPCHFDTSLVLPPLIRPLKTGHEQFIQQDPFPRLDHRLHQCVRAKTYSIWNQYCGLCTKLTYVTWPYMSVTTEGDRRLLVFWYGTTRSSLLIPLKEHDKNAEYSPKLRRRWSASAGISVLSLDRKLQDHLEDHIHSGS